MDDRTEAAYKIKSTQLRAHLKKWESDWAASHNGSKPSRQDIKDNPNIAEKYLEYNETRDILSGKISLPVKEQSANPKKRRSDTAPAETPQKRTKHTETPVKNRPEEDADFMNTPAISRKLFSPAPVTCIGPTPQRDGKVLGLFDLLVERELGTPSKSTGKAPSTPGRRRDVDATPSKRRGSFDSEKLGRTPMSSSKRHMLDFFMTPLKNRNALGTQGKTITSPGSVSNLQFDTPAFLRRHTLPALQEGFAFDDPAPLRLPRKPLGRGLSEIVASLRQMEDDKLDDDDDMAALRESEAATTTPAEQNSAAVPVVEGKKSAEDEMLAPDHDVERLPLGGFDDEAAHDGSHEADVNGGGQPQVVYKKKGQKRTTRLVRMRPTITKRPTAALDASQDLIPETQLDGDENVDGDGDGDDNNGLSASDYDEDGNKKSKSKSKVKSKKSASKSEGVAKKSLRKVNELAHANFTRLKLKSKNPKGRRGGFGRRFGRR